MLFPMSSFQTFQFISSGPNGTCSIFLFSFISSYLKKKGGGGNLGWVDGLQLISTYHIPELVHPESVAVVTIVSLHIVFSDFINILQPNQSPEKYNYFLYKSEDNGSNWVVNIPPGVKIKDDRISSKHYFLT